MASLGPTNHLSELKDQPIYTVNEEKVSKEDEEEEDEPSAIVETSPRSNIHNTDMPMLFGEQTIKDEEPASSQGAPLEEYLPLNQAAAGKDDMVFNFKIDAYNDKIQFEKVPRAEAEFLSEEQKAAMLVERLLNS